MRKKKTFFVILLSVFLFTSCWNYREINDLSIVSGFGVDKGKKDKKYMITAEILTPTATTKSLENMNSVLVSSEGDTIFKAIRKLIEINGKWAYWGHSKIIVLSKSIAEEGIIPVIDLIDRNPETRPFMHILIAENTSARRLFELNSSGLQEKQAITYKIEDALKYEDKVSTSKSTETWKFIYDTTAEGIEPVIPLISVIYQNGVSKMKIGGIAVIKKDKMIGKLDEHETEFYSLITNSINGGILEITKQIIGGNSNISLEILGGKTKLKPLYINGKVKMVINTDLDVSLVEIAGSDDFIIKSAREKLKRDVEQYIESEMIKVINKVQAQYDSDIFGFGNTVKDKMPTVWKALNNDWDTQFSTLNTDVNVTINIKKTELTSEPIKVGK